jgi:hypothetical protein
VCFYDIGGGFEEVALNVTHNHLLLPSKAFAPAEILIRADGATYQSKPGLDPIRDLARWIMTGFEPLKPNNMPTLRGKTNQF